MKWKIAPIVLLCGLWLMAGCSMIQDTYNATDLANEMQISIDHANQLSNQQTEIDKIMTSANPNTTDKAAIKKALDDLKRAKEQVIPAYEQTIKKIKSEMDGFQVKVDKLEKGEVKQLAETSMKSFQAMMDAELAFTKEAREYTVVQNQFFSLLKNGQEPTDSQIDDLNGEVDNYSKSVDQLNAKIDLFNKDWEKLANKSGVEI